jgi:hypothetical protein
MKLDVNLNFLQTVRNAYENRSEPEMVYTSARVLWYAVLGVSACLVVAAFVIGVWMFQKALATTSASEEVVPVTRAERVKVDTQALQQALNAVDARKAKFDMQKALSPTLVDPS